MRSPLRDPELLVCSRRGHVFAKEHAHPTADGRHFAQCLRCRSWVVVDDEPAPFTATPPRRGRELRQAIVIRLIAIDRIVHTVAFAAVFVAALVVEHQIGSIHSWAQSTLASLNSAQHGSGGASSHGLIAALLTRLANVKPHSLNLLALFAAGYATVSALEAVGLWMEKRWAEYLTVLATAAFLPLEIRELVDRVTLVRIGAMVVNIAILVYLVWTKHLFGIGRPDEPEAPDPMAPLPEIVAAAP